FAHFLQLHRRLLGRTNAMHLQNIVSQAYQRPLDGYLLFASPEKLAKPSTLFDLSKDRLDNRLSLRVDGSSRFRSDLLGHSFHSGRIRWKPSSSGRRPGLSVVFLLGRYVAGDFTGLQMFKIRVG